MIKRLKVQNFQPKIEAGLDAIIGYTRHLRGDKKFSVDNAVALVRREVEDLRVNLDAAEKRFDAQQAVIKKATKWLEGKLPKSNVDAWKVMFYDALKNAELRDEICPECGGMATHLPSSSMCKRVKSMREAKDAEPREGDAK